jgi:uncharacterized protein (TIGR03435 family)
MFRAFFPTLVAAIAWGHAPEFDVVDLRVAQALPAGTAQVLLDDGPAVVQLNPGISHILAQPFAESGTVTLRYYSMRRLIMAAYQEAIREEYIVVPAGGGPSWLDSDHFDLIAKTAPGTPKDAERTMLQKALADRFHLVIHREQRPMAVFVLTAGKNELKLKKPEGSGDPDCSPFPRRSDARRRGCHNMTMSDLARQLPELARGYIDRPVVDETNLAGSYDFELEWMPRPPPGADPVPGATVFDAIEKLGLRLEEHKKPMPVIVIDHVEKPDAN